MNWRGKAWEFPTRPCSVLPRTFSRQWYALDIIAILGRVWVVCSRSYTKQEKLWLINACTVLSTLYNSSFGIQSRSVCSVMSGNKSEWRKKKVFSKKYWLDLNGSGQAVLVYCDMKIEGFHSQLDYSLLFNLKHVFLWSVFLFYEVSFLIIWACSLKNPFT